MLTVTQFCTGYHEQNCALGARCDLQNVMPRVFLNRNRRYFWRHAMFYQCLHLFAGDEKLFVIVGIFWQNL